MSIARYAIAALACVGSFYWGMAVDRNDQRLLAAYDAHMTCGPTATTFAGGAR